MREFPQEDVLSAVIARGGLTETHVDELARAVAGFHQGTASVSVDRGGAAPPVSADTPIELARANFTEIAPLLASDGDRRAVRSLERWTDGEIDRLAPVFRRRWSAGFVRDGHGDLHAGNAAIVDGRITLFDCVEFNDTMRWGDVMADVAFMVMDLHARGRPDFAHRFLNAYLEQTGDYEGLDVLRFYVVFRAMVRAKVAAIRAYADTASRDASIADCRDHLALAERCAATRRGAVVIAHGFSGCGKSTVAQRLVDWCGAIRIRTDVERKRLHGLPPAARTGSPLNAGLYTADETSRTYEAIGRIAGCVARAGYSAIADGAFLKRWQRDRLRAAAQEAGVSFLIFDVVASEATLRRRIEARGRDPSEADLDVLASQMATSEPLEDDELARTVRYDTELIECELMPPAGNPAVSTGPRERSETHSGISPGTKFAH
jgi:predicted kinase